MSNYQNAKDAGWAGEDLYHVTRRYGDTAEVRNAYEEGRIHRRYSSNERGNNNFGQGMNLIGILTAGLILLAILYGPFVAIMAILLAPFFYMGSEPSLGQLAGLGFVLVTGVYLMSCWFEYHRARMLEARYKNHTWKLSFCLLFACRIIMPGLAVSVWYYIFGHKGVVPPDFFSRENLGNFAATTLVCALPLMWKVKILNPEHRYYFTEWTYSKGVASMAALEGRDRPLPPTNISAIYFWSWAGLTILLSLAIYPICKEFLSFIFRHLPYNITMVLVVQSGCLLSRLIVDRTSKVFLQEDFAKKQGIPLIFYLKTTFRASLVFFLSIFFDFSYEYEWLFELFIVVFLILIYQQIKKFAETETVLEAGEKPILEN